MEDGERSEVYGVREETVRLTRVWTIHVEVVNKCVHKGKLM